MGDLLGSGDAGALAGFDVAGLIEALDRVLDDETRRLELGRRAIELASAFEYSKAIGIYANGLRKLAGEPEVRL